jgi:hypothetical protein
MSKLMNLKAMRKKTTTILMLLMLSLNIYASHRVNRILDTTPNQTTGEGVCGVNAKFSGADSTINKTRITVGGVSHTPSKKEAINIINKRIPSILDKFKKAGVDPGTLFINNNK